MEIIVKINKSEDIHSLLNADAFLLSHKNFSFRYDESFSLQKTKKFILICKKYQKKVYFNINKIFKDQELAKLERFIKNIIDLKIDGIFFTDFAVFMIAKKYHFEQNTFFAHETFLRNTYDILTYQKLGIHNIICSKDIHIDAISHLPEANKHTYGIYVFGYFCLYQSQRKILTNYITHNQLDKALISNKNLFLKEDKRSGMYRVLQQNHFSFIFNDQVLSYLNDFSKLNQYLNYFILDSLFFDAKYISLVIDLFKQFKNNSDLKKLDETISFTDGNLNHRIGLM